MPPSSPPLCLAAATRSARIPGAGPRHSRHGPRLALLAAALVLSGCQTGGALPIATAAAGAAAAQSNTAAAVPAAALPLPGNCAPAETAAQALAKLNDYRAAGARCGSTGRQGAAAALLWQPALALLAAVHSRSMAEQGGLTHGSGARSLTQRLDAGGYAWQGAAENLAVGQTRLALVLADWVSSAAHCANLMNPSYSEAGLACQRAADGRAYWTLILARPR